MFDKKTVFFLFYVMCLNDVVRKLLHKISLFANVFAFFQIVSELDCWKFYNSAFFYVRKNKCQNADLFKKVTICSI